MKKLLFLILFLFLCPLMVQAQSYYVSDMFSGTNTGNFKNITANAIYGSELITWTAAGWDEGGVEWTVAGTPIVITHATGNTTALTSTLASAITAGVTYKVVITYAQVAGMCSYTLGGVTGSSIATSATSTSITDYITASTTVQMIIKPLTTSNIVISSISIKELTDATGDLTVDGNLTVRSPARFWGPLSIGSAPWTIKQIRDATYGNNILNISNGTYSFGFFPTSDNTVTVMDSTGITYETLSAASFVVQTSVSILSNELTAGYNFGSAYDIQLRRDSAGVLAQRNSTNQQKSRIYNTYTDASNYETLALTGVAGASVNVIAETAGTGGDNLDIVLTPAGTGQIKTTLSDNNGGCAITINANQAGVTATDTFMDFRSTTGSEATIAGTAVAGVLAYNTFTGSHYTKIVNKPETVPIGTVLEMTGNLIGEWPDKSYIEKIDVVKDVPFIIKSTDEVGNLVEKPLLDEMGEPETYQITEKKNILHDLKTAPKQYLAESRICATKGSRAVYGVYGGTDKEGRDMVLALGTGVILVLNTGKNIEAGDFLISSAIKGHAELQGDDFYRNSTIAKSTQNIIWKTGEISRLVACIYLGG